MREVGSKRADRLLRAELPPAGPMAELRPMASELGTPAAIVDHHVMSAVEGVRS